MTLLEWLQGQNLRDAEFAEKIGVEWQTVQKYRKGQRIPRPDIMKKIAEQTGGKVTANDFYGKAA